MNLKNTYLRAIDNGAPFNDRYAVLGIEPPKLETMCRGGCDGVGYYPTKDKASPAWKYAHLKAICDNTMHPLLCDGWHFIQCADCGGTGRIAGQPSVWGDRKVEPE